MDPTTVELTRQEILRRLDEGAQRRRGRSEQENYWDVSRH